MSAVERVARRLYEVRRTQIAATLGVEPDEWAELHPQIQDQERDLARAAVAAIRPMDAATERAVALASCNWGMSCECRRRGSEVHCLTRARRTVDALVKAMEDGQ